MINFFKKLFRIDDKKSTTNELEIEDSNLCMDDKLEKDEEKLKKKFEKKVPEIKYEYKNILKITLMDGNTWQWSTSWDENRKDIYDPWEEFVRWYHSESKRDSFVMKSNNEHKLPSRTMMLRSNIKQYTININKEKVENG